MHQYDYSIRLFGIPHYYLVIESALAGWITWQIITGKLIYKRFPTVRREENPKAFWFGIIIQALPTLGVICMSTQFVMGFWVVGFLFFALFLGSVVGLSWFLGRSIWHNMEASLARWQRRK